MWARVIEIMLGCWLALSPFVFRISGDDTMIWVMDFASAATIIVCALLSYWSPTRHAHLFTLLVAIALIGFGRFAASPPGPPELQNLIIVGLLLLMFSLVPNHASQPPREWQ